MADKAICPFPPGSRHETASALEVDAATQHAIGAQHEPLTANNFRQLVDSHAESSAYILRLNDSASLSDSSVAYLSEGSLVLQSLRQSLYAFTTEPSWFHHFIPASAIDEAGEYARLPKIGPDFNLTALQQDHGYATYSEDRRGKACGHVFKIGEGVYHCANCGIDPTCALCIRCFNASEHEGHDVIYSIHNVGGGCCDCGDAEAWKEPGGIPCAYHSPRTPEEEAAYIQASGNNGAHLPADVDAALQRAISVAIEFIITTLARSPEDMKPPETPNAVQEQLSKAEEEFWDVEVRRERVKAFQKNEPNAPSTTSNASPGSDASHKTNSLWGQLFAASVKGKERRPSLPDQLDTEMLPYDLDFKEHLSMAVPKRSRGPWSVVLWNDEKHSYEQVIEQVSRAVGCSRAQAVNVARRVDEHGREIILVHNDPAKLYATAKMISDIDLAVTVRHANDVFDEQVCDLLIEFLGDMCSSRVLGVRPDLSDLPKRRVFEALVQQRGSTGTGGCCYFEQLLLSDVKLWHGARRALKGLYIGLLAIGSPERVILSRHFGAVYSNLVDHYLLIDRESEHSIIHYSVQIVTVPSVVKNMVDVGFLDTLLDMLYAFFTEQFLPVDAVEGDHRHLLLPPDFGKTDINPEGWSFRHKRYFQLFREIGYVLSCAPVKKFVCSNLPLLGKVARFLDLFTNMNPSKRAVNEHVEFETDAWVTAFNLTIQLSKLATAFGECFSETEGDQVLVAVQALATFLAPIPGQPGVIGSSRSAEAGYNHLQVAFGCLGPASPKQTVIDFRNETEAVSFHHPVNWLFAEVCRYFHFYDLTPLPPSSRHIGAVMQNRTDGLGPMIIGENVFRVVSLLAQIRAGLWVRNGFGIRAQQLHYREYGVRESTFDQDLFNLQVLLCIENPNVILLSMINRFGLRQWLNGETMVDRIGDMSQIITLLEELLYFLIAVMTEPSGVVLLSSGEFLRREVVHVLCQKPLSYSDIMKKIPERYKDESAFSKCLDEVSTYHEPAGVNDIGMFSLRPEFLGEIDPYHYRFDRNQREAVESIVLEHLRKTSGNPNAIYMPKPLAVRTGPFAHLTQTLVSEAMIQTVFYCLARVNPQTKLYSEYLADEAIYLVMLGLIEEPQKFASLAVSVRFPLKGNENQAMTLANMLKAVEDEPAMKAVKPKVTWCLDKIHELQGAVRVNSTVDSGPRGEDEKKAVARARQAAIMSQMSAAQQAFLDQNDFEDDDEDEVMDAVEVSPSLGSCILCQADLKETDSFGMLAFIQTTGLIRFSPQGHEAIQSQAEEWLREVLIVPDNLDDDGRVAGPFGVAGRGIITVEDESHNEDDRKGSAPQTLRGLHASACGHLMHLECFETYYKSIEQRHHTHVTRNHPENIERCEFLCPLCKSIGNVVLPLSDEGFCDLLNENTSLAEWFKTSTQHSAGPFHGIDKSFVSPWVIEADGRLRRPAQLGSSSLTEDEFTMLDRFFNVVSSLHAELGVFAQQSNMPGPQYGTIDDAVVARTIACLEISVRGQGTKNGVVAAIPEFQIKLLNSLLGVLRKMTDLSVTSVFGCEMARQALPSQLVVQDLNVQPLLLRSPLAFLVQVAILAPDMFHKVIGICYHLHILQTLLAFAAESISMPQAWWDFAPMVHRQGNEDFQEINICKQYLGLISKKIMIAQPALCNADPVVFGKILYAHALPFLRRAAILQAALPRKFRSGALSLPEALMDANELTRLKYQLKVPDWSDPSDLRRIWIDHASRWILARPSNHRIRLLPQNEHPTIYELIYLPKRYDAILTDTASRKCRRCDTIPNDAALCLICGTLVCMQSYCCMGGSVGEDPQYGEANRHMWMCGGSVAVYLEIKKCALFYLASENGTFDNAPFLDDRGEMDPGLKRGRQQTLHRPRWDEVRKLWLSHSIPKFVARKQEANQDGGGWPTF